MRFVRIVTIQKPWHFWLSSCQPTLVIPCCFESSSSCGQYGPARIKTTWHARLAKVFLSSIVKQWGQHARKSVCLVVACKLIGRRAYLFEYADEFVTGDIFGISHCGDKLLVPRKSHRHHCLKSWGVGYAPKHCDNSLEMRASIRASLAKLPILD